MTTSSFMILLIISCMLVTAIPRVAPFIFVRSIQLPEVVLKWLSFIPLCILTALIAEHLLVQTGGTMTFNWIYLTVLIPTVFTAIGTKSLSMTVLVGVALMAAARWFFS
ncbi:AzlD domain-containing protein [Bacillus sp. NPDC077027]|uniref:AzlD domain-containing protein n=1 Tax=Bacillus sp. NPDC077027 TaxID=3390548 RepID=UPI003D019D1B